MTGVVLAIARVIGETAPIFIAASFTDNFNAEPVQRPDADPAGAWPTRHTGSPARTSPRRRRRRWGAALLLVILVVIFNLIARIVATVFAPKSR